MHVNLCHIWCSNNYTKGWHWCITRTMYPLLDCYYYWSRMEAKRQPLTYWPLPLTLIHQRPMGSWRDGWSHFNDPVEYESVHRSTAWGSAPRQLDHQNEMRVWCETVAIPWQPHFHLTWVQRLEREITAGRPLQSARGWTWTWSEWTSGTQTNIGPGSSCWKTWTRINRMQEQMVAFEKQMDYTEDQRSTLIKQVPDIERKF